jgi:peptidoglycan/LPS O-acetylase OafA/YrhL
VEPTLYFIPLIIQLYFLQPGLKALPRWLHAAIPSLTVERCATLLAGLLLAVHLTIGLLCNRGVLNYYVWGRPNVFFWMFYFFAGLHFRSITLSLSPRALRALCVIFLVVGVAAMTWNGRQLLNHTLMGANFELNRLDFAYVRPEMLVYDLAIVLGLAAGIKLAWRPRAGFVSYLGRYTLEIYLWHILVLYFGAWKYADVYESCQRQPELIVIICAATCLVIASLTDGWERLKTYMRGHQLAIIDAD